MGLGNQSQCARAFARCRSSARVLEALNADHASKATAADLEGNAIERSVEMGPRKLVARGFPKMRAADRGARRGDIVEHSVRVATQSTVPDAPCQPRPIPISHNIQRSGFSGWRQASTSRHKFGRVAVADLDRG